MSKQPKLDPLLERLRVLLTARAQLDDPIGYLVLAASGESPALAEKELDAEIEAITKALKHGN